MGKTIYIGGIGTRFDTFAKAIDPKLKKAGIEATFSSLDTGLFYNFGNNKIITAPAIQYYEQLKTIIGNEEDVNIIGQDAGALLALLYRFGYESSLQSTQGGVYSSEICPVRTVLINPYLQKPEKEEIDLINGIVEESGIDVADRGESLLSTVLNKENQCKLVQLQQLIKKLLSKSNYSSKMQTLIAHSTGDVNTFLSGIDLLLNSNLFPKAENLNEELFEQLIELNTACHNPLIPNKEVITKEEGNPMSLQLKIADFFNR